MYEIEKLPNPIIVVNGIIEIKYILNIITLDNDSKIVLCAYKTTGNKQMRTNQEMKYIDSDIELRNPEYPQIGTIYMA